VHEHASALAEHLAGLLSEHGRDPVPRAHTTLVTFPSADAVAERTRLAQDGVIVRNIPGRPWLRASVGAWNHEGDLQRLLDALDRGLGAAAA
jgi:selenocysteine lyase/cysteine desulfurase